MDLETRNLLKCIICKEYYTNPVISSSCFHSFCSFCIRTHLNTTLSCPVCSKEMIESTLVRVPIVEELARAARKQPVSRQEPLSRAQPENVKTTSGYQYTPRKKRKTLITNFTNTEQQYSDKLWQEAGKSKGGSEIVVVEDEPELVSLSELVLVPEPAPVPTVKPVGGLIKSGPKLPKLDFGQWSINKIKQKLKSLNISTVGSKNELQERYNYYQTLYNANLDTAHPVSSKELLLKLKQWDNVKLLSAHNSGIFKDFTDLENWAVKYKKEFQDLVKAARKLKAPGS